jgi:hypothetical protein
MSQSSLRRSRTRGVVVAGLLGAGSLVVAAVAQADQAGAAPLPTGSAQWTPSGSGSDDGPDCRAGVASRVFATGGPLTGPDDITTLQGAVFVAYQNGVGAKGEPSTTGNTDSTVVEYARSGRALAHWQVTGKVDGMAADPQRRRVVATVNEDGNSSLYTITPDDRSDELRHYTYTPSPLPHGGGTDSIAVLDGTLFVTASAPAPDANGTTYSGPALYRVSLAGSTATATGVLKDNSTAVDAGTGRPVTLNLSDPDSSTVVPRQAPRFAGQVMLDSQGDSQEIFIAHPGRSDQRATVLHLNTQVDDSAVVSASCGTLLVTDAGKDEVVAVTGRFPRGQVFTSVPNDSTTLPATLGTLDLSTGKVSAYSAAFSNPKGLLYLPSGRD